MSTKASKPRKPSKTSEIERRAEADRQILGSLSQLNDGLQQLAGVVDHNGQHAFERIQNLETHFASLHKVMKRVIDSLEQDRDQGDWWRGNGGSTPNA
jgi:hypothetical protein